MVTQFSDNILEAFDVPPEDYDFLASILDKGIASQDDLKLIHDQSLLGTTKTPRPSDDVLEAFDIPPEDYDFLASILDKGTASQRDLKLMFDQSLLAGVETWNHEVDTAFADLLGKTKRKSANASKKKKRTREDDSRNNDQTVSRFWQEDGHTEVSRVSSKKLRQRDSCRGSTSRVACLESEGTVALFDCLSRCVPPERWYITAPDTVHDDAGTSPYFASSVPNRLPSQSKRPARGTVSCIPFPPLSASSFGIVQEQVAHEPFWLLVVVTFLIKTSGKLAIPVFFQVKERFPTPFDIASAANAPEILGMIQHLGLGRNRLRFLQKYAQAFMFDPPRAGVRYAVRGYDSGDAIEKQDGSREADGGGGGGGGGWEIGHLTQGRYAIDSWRIFCRDVLLGRASDWDGKGREAEFQPEWMRVLPADKELRAFLRWMWMREGWGWDPTTGERQVLRDELCQGVNDGRVEYDEQGGIRILAMN